MAFRSIFASRIGRRSTAHMAACALIPIALLAAVVAHVEAERSEQDAAARLASEAHLLGASLFERLVLADLELQLLVRTLEANGSTSSWKDSKGLRLTRVEILPLPIEDPEVGAPSADLALNGPQLEHLRSGLPVLQFERGEEAPTAYLTRWLTGSDSNRVIRAQLDLREMWTESVEQRRIATVETAVGSRNVGLLAGSLASNRLSEMFGPGTVDLDQGAPLAVVALRGQPYVAHSTDLALRRFAAPELTVTVAVPRASWVASRPTGAGSVALVGLFALGMGFALGGHTSGRLLRSADAIRAALGRLRDGDLDARVADLGRDELAALGPAANEMADRLRERLWRSAERTAMHGRILSSLDLDATAEAVIDYVGRLTGASAVSLSTNDAAAPGACKTHESGGRMKGGARIVATEEALGAPDLFQPGATHHWFEPGCWLPSGLGSLRRPHQRVLTLPIRIDGRLEGLLALAIEPEVEIALRQIEELGELADQIATSLSNARMLNALSAMHDGALTALARTVDAKSTWTLGHSERVTGLALELARELGVDNAGLETIHRGGLLHDIGKIGVPNAILDKPTRLTAQEFEVIKSHPLIGARIIEPLKAYHDALPIVEQHHERYDGLGYPHGLAGEDIHFYARIFAVADVFDACRSDRPYRPGMDVNSVIKIIRDGSETQFDPEVVSAFLNLVAARSWAVFGAPGGESSQQNRAIA